MTGPTYNSLGMESGRNIMRGCPDKRVDMSISRDIRMGGNRTLEFRLDVFNVFDTVIYTGRSNQIQYNSPTDLTIRNSQTLADGRWIRRGWFRATRASARRPAPGAAQHAAPVPVRVLDRRQTFRGWMARPGPGS